ncbi:hypothetical protein [Brevibacillus sp. 179-C 1.1 NHS]|uniref:hypothetical protein n=1 Tax=Brevibacillus sp. 179-C 1.1 NHS TaxID=3235177 RepID=UPI0039A167BE
MSQANIPNITPSITLTREDSISLILASIAMEGLGLGNIIHAEAEKIQYAVGTIPGLTATASLSDLLAVNSSVRDTLQAIIKKDMLLQNKLACILTIPTTSSSDITGDTGTMGVSGTTYVTGPTGPTSSTPGFTNVELGSLELDTPIIVLPGDGIPLLHTFVIDGTDIAHTAGESCIFLAGGHSYSVNYVMNAEPLTNLIIFASLRLNGVLIPGTGLDQDGQPGTIGMHQGTGNGIVVVPPGPPQCLELVNLSGDALSVAHVRIVITEIS